MEIQTTTTQERQEVIEVNREAFWNQYTPGAIEHYLVSQLFDSPDYIPSLDLVAKIDQKIVGHLMCLKATLHTQSEGVIEILTLGPVCVLPAFQNRGIAAKLIQEAQQRAIKMSIPIIMLCGDPNYYCKFGFESAENQGIYSSMNTYMDALMVYFCNPALKQKVSGMYQESQSYHIDPKEAELYDADFPFKEKLSGTASQRRFEELLTKVKPI